MKFWEGNVFTHVCLFTGEGHALTGGMHGFGACMVGGVCVAGEHEWFGVYMAGGMQGGDGACMHGWGHALLGRTCVARNMHGCGECVAGG